MSKGVDKMYKGLAHIQGTDWCGWSLELTGGIGDMRQER